MYDEHIKKFPEYAKDAWKRAGDFKVLEEINTVIIAGSGTGYIAGEILKGYLGQKTRITAVNGFDLPLGDKKTLVFVASYTGNDPEALALYRAAVKRGCRILGVTSGGELRKSMERNVKEQVNLPAGLPDNASLPYLVFSILKILQNSGIIPNQENAVKSVLADLQTPYHTTAQQFSDNLKGKIVLIYASPKLSSVAKRWKSQLNQLARVPSFASTVDMAELSGFGNMLAGFHAIILRDANDLSDATKQLDDLKQGFRKLNISSTEIVVRKNDELTMLISASFIGDWIAFYLSQKYAK